jgi:hypothetical protein
MTNVIKHLAKVLALLLLLSSVGTAWGVGGVIRVGAAGGKLTVAGGVADNAGFADRVFVETGTDGFPSETSVSGFGPSFLWTVPGVRLDGLANNSGLYLEALLRPVKNASPAKERVLWYWDPTNGAIEDVPDDNHFLIYRGFASQSIFLAGTDDVAPPRLKIANPLASDQGFDTYGTFVRFALHRQVPPPAGVYGFFARFTSDVYQSSDPFLVTFNQGQLSANQMTAGALAINSAAVSESAMPGDFNHDGAVDAADYSVWRNGLGTTSTQAEYLEWKNNFGSSTGGGSAESVPEPAGIQLILFGVLIARMRRERTI